ncbi:hypothetical protein Aperf_G00000105152 [Anoplocephala perfoliata]
MTGMLESDTLFSKWLAKYLNSLSSDIDPELCGEYVEGMLKDDTLDAQEIKDSISSFLESVIPSEDAVKCSQKIFSYFQEQVAKPDNLSGTVSKIERNNPDSLDILEETMRSMLADSKGLTIAAITPSDSSKTSSTSTKRDACTIAVLRAAGVSGYQGDEQAEAELAVNLANAEYVAKQEQGPLSGAGFTPSSTGIDFAAMEPESEDIDLSEIETAQGYGKTDGIQPGNIMEALATLNPDKFSHAEAAKVTPAEKLNAIRQIKRLPTPGDINSSTTPGYVLLNARGANIGVTGLQENATGATTTSTNSAIQTLTGKKKSAPPPKKLADIGARAEEKHRRMLAKKKEKMVAFGAAGNRLDDMDAFFISDDDNDNDKLREDNILLAGGGNAELAAAEPAKQARVISGKEFSEREKVKREKQLEAETKRKANAQQQSQKVERRRH